MDSHRLSIDLTAGQDVVMGGLFLVFHGTFQFLTMLVMLNGRLVLARPVVAEGPRLTTSGIATFNISLDIQILSSL